MTPTLRLGVTGLSRAGKTVFITSLVRNLIVGGRLPFFKPHAEGRILRAFLEPQPDDDVPRFDYERHLTALSAQPPEWPQSTRRISELRVTIEYEPTNKFMRMLGPARLHLDIVDYPGEWLTDLGMLDLPYTDWAETALGHVKRHGDGNAAIGFTQFIEALPAVTLDAHAAEQLALEGARHFTAYLAEARQSNGGISTLSPGRFLMPGDHEGSPLLTFFPLARAAEEGDALLPLLQRRYESYKTHIVRPFFKEHFSRIDRQIVLVDALGAINGGAKAVADLERALSGVLAAFRPGTNTWLSSLISHRVDHLLFAATKADHLHQADHDRLEALLRHITDRAIARAETAGASVRVMALAALRATREAEAKQGNEKLACIIGTPLPGEKLDDRVFDGNTEVAIFPGDLPADPAAALADAERDDNSPRDLDVIRFRPPRLALAAKDGQPLAMPHIRLDRAMDFLIGDRIR
ncbi:MAG: YcjX family protein [Hyphomicrobiaceae bacterium]|nr:YcjX family protein [Hyphomicrobiaceae bacterium]